MSNYKCTFSEQPLEYMEVYHFKPKTYYPDLVVRWGNLLPVCKKCNVAKGKSNVPMVNPLILNRIKKRLKDCGSKRPYSAVLST
jgi:5-methylcytosine-specific restriction endonuclease McrA